jgi:hypothetical protein
MTKDEILKQEWNSEIDKLCQNRVVQGFYSYGPIKINFGEGLVKALSMAENRIADYKRTRNKEYLLDAMNYLRYEFDYPSLTDTYFKETTDRGVLTTTFRDIERISGGVNK